MKLLIGRIIRRKVNTKFGEKNTFALLNDHDNQWYSCFEKRGFTDNLKEGTEIEVPQVKSRQVGEKTYYDIIWPDTRNQDPEVHRKLDEILNILKSKPSEASPFEDQGMDTDTPPPMTDEDAPPF